MDFALTRIAQRSDAPIALRLNNILAELEVCAEVAPALEGTQVHGNCLFEALCQSLYFSYPEDLRYSRYMDPQLGPPALRKDLCRWVIESSELIVDTMKTGFETLQAQRWAEGRGWETWEEFWGRMEQDAEWAEDIVTFAVALFLELDVRQITDTSKKSNPWQLFSGNRTDVTVLLDRAPILLGYVSSLHYVSLRPAEGVPLKLRLEDFETIGMDATLKSIELAVKLATQYMAESLLGSVPLSCSGVSLTPCKEKSKFRLDCDKHYAHLHRLQEACLCHLLQRVCW